MVDRSIYAPSHSHSLFSCLKVKTKLRRALEQKLGVIACLGETLADRKAGDTAAVVTRQVRTLFLVRVCASETLLVGVYGCRSYTYTRYVYRRGGRVFHRLPGELLRSA